jgi:hypothetical protein
MGSFELQFGLYLAAVTSSLVLVSYFFYALQHLGEAQDYKRKKHLFDKLKVDLAAMQDEDRDKLELLNRWDKNKHDREIVEKEARSIEGKLKALEEKRAKHKLESEAVFKSLAELREEFGGLKEEKGRLEAAVAALTKDKSDIQGAIGNLEARQAELTSSIAGLDAAEKTAEGKATIAQDKLEPLRTELAALSDTKLPALRKEHSGLESQIASLKTSKTEATNALELIEGQWKTFKENYEGNRETLVDQWNVFKETYETTLGKLDTQWTESLGQWTSSQEQTRQMVERQWGELKDHIDKAVDIINGTWNRMTPPQAAESDEKYRDLWEPVLRERDFPGEGAAPSEIAALDETRTYLKNCGLEYPDRAVNAFHTCLKVNGISPLTVLAGISGTGKSELPRRYAEGMGMHFLPVPVQPRWDSPQDLFGFYNYVEGRYKATELARALVQMESYNQDDYPESVKSLNGRMLMVLLDEMNLARVEYYFSEFLSKLETRRGIKHSKPGSRQKAEIAFEMGALSEGEKHLHIFPDQNILFTGTMNEDETTMALSDKVLDRANVLRFGRPRSLARSQGHEANKAVATSRALSASEWLEWYREPSDTLDNDTRGRLAEWTKQLNDALAKVRRPFGHRASLAIETYVANYPATGALRLMHGFSDQLEQRIMPKLRGLDTADPSTIEALDIIESLIKAADDRTLLDAFRTNRSEDLFLWGGIDRSEDQ